MNEFIEILKHSIVGTAYIVALLLAIAVALGISLGIVKYIRGLFKNE